MPATFCTSLILNTNNANVINAYNTYAEYDINFKTLLLDNYEHGAYYNLVLQTVLFEDAPTNGFTGGFIIDCPAMLFQNTDYLYSPNAYRPTTRAIYPLVSINATNTVANIGNSNIASTFKLVNSFGKITMQHYEADNSMSYATLMQEHCISFDIYKITE